MTRHNDPRPWGRELGIYFWPTGDGLPLPPANGGADGSSPPELAGHLACIAYDDLALPPDTLRAHLALCVAEVAGVGLAEIPDHCAGITISDLRSAVMARGGSAPVPRIVWRSRASEWQRVARVAVTVAALAKAFPDGFREEWPARPATVTVYFAGNAAGKTQLLGKYLSEWLHHRGQLPDPHKR